MELKSISELQWKNRVLLYFPENGMSVKDQGLEEEILERKLVWFEFGGDLKTNFQKPIHPEFVNLTRQEYSQISPGTWVLVGLDGGIKKTGTGSLDWEVVFSTIDSMPMRKAEKSRKNSF